MLEFVQSIHEALLYLTMKSPPKNRWILLILLIIYIYVVGVISTISHPPAEVHANS